MNEDLRATLNRGDESETAIIIPLCESAFDAHVKGLTGRRISREGGKAEGFDGRCRLDPRGCAALRAAQAADAIRRPVVAGAKRPRQRGGG